MKCCDVGREYLHKARFASLFWLRDFLLILRVRRDYSSLLNSGLMPETNGGSSESPFVLRLYGYHLNGPKEKRFFTTPPFNTSSD